MRFAGHRYCAVLLTFFEMAASAQVSVLTANYNRNRTNANLNETILAPSTVNPNSFGKVASYLVDGAVYAQPLYVSQIDIPGQGQRNIVYVATMHNSVYAFDADAAGRPDPIWQVHLGPAVPPAALNFTDIKNEIGILSTPVIDVTAKVIYVVTDTYEASSPVFRLHALSLLDGHEVLNGPVVISASVAGSGAGAAADGTLPFDASQHLQRPGLTLANGKVYIGFGAHADKGEWHGWLFAYDAADLKHLVAVLNTTPDGAGGSIWQSGRAPAVDRNGNVYVATGNGDYDGVTSFSESLLELSGEDLSIMSSFTPGNWQDLNERDWDLGSTGAVLLPDSNAVFTGGKSGDMFVLERAAPSGSMPLPRTAHLKSSLSTPAGVFDVALWENQDGRILYVFQSWGSLQAYRLVGATFDGNVVSQTLPSALTLYAGVAVSANGGQNGTGIVWQTSGNYDIDGIPGSLHAYDALDLTNELWNSDMRPDRDTMGAFTKFAAPTIANGRVYVPTLSQAVVVYGQLEAAPRHGNGPGPPRPPRY